MAYSHAGSNICLDLSRGKGPVPPDLLALRDIGVDMEGLDAVIDILFRLDRYDSSSPPMLWKGGKLRPMVEAVFASMVMYYPETKRAGEVHSVLVAMQSAFSRGRMVDVDGTMHYWSGILRGKFNIDNLHLTDRSADSGHVQIVAAVQQLGAQVSGLHSAVSAVQRHLSSAASDALAVLPASPTVAGVAATAAGPAAGAAAAVRSSGANLASAASSSGGLLHQAKASATAGLLQASASASPEYSLTNKTAKEFILDCMAPKDPGATRGCLPKNLNKQHKNKGNLCFEWFRGMATPGELRIVVNLPPARRSQAEPAPPALMQIDEGPWRRVVDLLHDLIVERLKAGFVAVAHKVPPLCPSHLNSKRLRWILTSLT